MKKKWLAAFLIVSAMFILPIVGGEAGYLMKEVKAESAGIERHTITVSGVGEVTATPDVAHIQFGVQTEGKTAIEAYQSNAATFERIKAALAEQNIANKDIQTVRFNAYPNYDYKESGRELTGYQVNHIISVTHRDLDVIGKFLDSLAQVGVNRVENIQYGTEKKDDYELKALENALENARQKADVVAKKQGKALKGVLHIQEGSGYNAPVFRDFGMEKVAQDSSASSNMEIYSGELTITKQVQVTYQFD